MKVKLTEKDKKDLHEFTQAISKASRLRTFPNNRNMDMTLSVFLNNIGKLFGEIDYLFSILLWNNEFNHEANKMLIEFRRKLHDVIK